jgi:hypothetical protein
MKENLFVVSYDYELTKRLSKRLAEIFSLRLFDQKELFEFDNLPFDFAQVCEKQGKDYVMNQFRSIVKMELDFSNALFVADISLADNCFDIFYQIKLNNFVIFLHKNNESEIDELSKKQFSNDAEKEFYFMSSETLNKRESLIKENCADIFVDISGLNDGEAIEKILKQIDEFYAC